MNAEREARELAMRFRERHRLGVQPLGDLAALIEQTTGYDVAVLDADNGEHGMTMRNPARETVFLAVARSSKPMRQRSSFAHELAHVLFEDWNAGENFAVRSPEEIRADAFARHLLVPVDGVKQMLDQRSGITESELSTVVQRYLVSPAIAAIALREAGYIDDSKSAQWMKIHTPELATRNGWRDQYDALQRESGLTRAPQKLLARAILGYAAGVVNPQTIATLRGLPVEQVTRELDEAGVIPTEFGTKDASLDEFPLVAVDLSLLDDQGM